ncbi:MAG: heme-binding protein [Sulfuricaulis sp.]|nr:heme-binding protein [Sulfuricaulis sp.]
MAIPGEKAIQMVRSAHNEAAQLDIAVTAVVVDPSGRMIALGRMDKARPITVEIALNKAYTAASFQQPTKDLAGIAGQSWFQSLVVSSSGRIMPGGGALPVVEGGNVVGAIAVAGGTEDQDQKCAEVALASYGGG